MFGYADDSLILCTSKNQLRRIIKLIKSWSSEFNLILNPSKSGILELLPLNDKKETLKVGSIFEGIPIVDKYKYLGVWLDRKLTLTPHLEHISKKSDYLYHKLWPLLRCVSLDYRINLWRILISPLFDMGSHLFSSTNPSSKESFLVLRRKTFKKFCLLKKNVNSDTVNKLIDSNFDERAFETSRISKIKWEARKNYSVPEYKCDNLLREKKEKHIRYPKELQEFLNLETAMCVSCKVPCSNQHMLIKHKIYIPDHEFIFQKMKEINVQNNRNTRTSLLKEAKNYLLPFINCLKKFLNRDLSLNNNVNKT